MDNGEPVHNGLIEEISSTGREEGRLKELEIKRSVMNNEELQYINSK